mmetsp:Transcript_9716/g.39520  ORF Transcript_9716/g.39520 Transcript_9716/m.39520 type:complete len:208 (-) Transcript_9716:196-819(-)
MTPPACLRRGIGGNWASCRRCWTRKDATRAGLLWPQVPWSLLRQSKISPCCRPTALLLPTTALGAARTRRCTSTEESATSLLLLFFSLSRISWIVRTDRATLPASVDPWTVPTSTSSRTAVSTLLRAILTEPSPPLSAVTTPPIEQPYSWVTRTSRLAVRTSCRLPLRTTALFLYAWTEEARDFSFMRKASTTTSTARSGTWTTACW